MRRGAGFAVLVVAAALAGCGGDDADTGKAWLGWDGTPVVRSSSTGARILIGKVKNESAAELRVTAPQVKVLDDRGRRIRSSATFVSSYVRSNYPHNGVATPRPAEYPEAEQRRVGYLAVLGSGKRTSLTVSWSQTRRARPAKRIVLGAASLEIPAKVIEAR